VGVSTEAGLLKKIENTLREILKWTRFANISRLKEILEAELDTDQKKVAFENTDGMRALDEVAAASGAPRDTVYGWWQRWSRLGLAMESGTRRGRMMRIASLDDVGIRIPRTTLVQRTTQATEQSPPSEREST